MITDADQLCTSTNRLVQSLQTNEHCNGRGLRLNLFIRPMEGGEGGGELRLILTDLKL